MMTRPKRGITSKPTRVQRAWPGLRLSAWYVIPNHILLFKHMPQNPGQQTHIGPPFHLVLMVKKWTFAPIFIYPLYPSVPLENITRFRNGNRPKRATSRGPLFFILFKSITNVIPQEPPKHREIYKTKRAIGMRFAYLAKAQGGRMDLRWSKRTRMRCFYGRDVRSTAESRVRADIYGQ